MADPRSPLTPIVAGPLGDDGPLGDTAVELDRGDCDVDDLDEVERLDLAAGIAYEVSGEARSCFGDGESAFVVEQARGAGTVVAVGGPDPFTNDGLGRADAAVLVADLLAPQPEGTRVAFLERGAPAIAGDGEETLTDLVPEPVTLALVQLGLAFAVYVWFRARRAGRPVAEPLPTTLAGSELVDAVGRLLQQERDPERSAGLLRDDLRRRLARRFGLSPGADLDDLVAAAERAGADPDRLRAVLAGPAGHRRRRPDHPRPRHRHDPTGDPDVSSTDPQVPPPSGPPSDGGPPPPRAAERRRPSGGQRRARRGGQGRRRPGRARCRASSPPCSCGGHVLLEGVPGVAKTLLVKALAGGLRPRRSSACSSPPT